jgi:recombination protein RecT
MSKQLQKTEKPTTVAGMMKTYKDQIALALPKHMTPDRMVRIVTTEMRKNVELMKCEPTSMFGAVIQCSQLGLEPGSALGHAYLLPFNNRKKGIMEVQVIIGYRGMIDMARRSGQIVSLSANCWYENDEFSYKYGLRPELDHTPTMGDPGKMLGAYAVAQLKDGGHQFEVMTLDAINKIKAKSKTSRFGPWVDHFEEMARKTVVRRLFKYLPVSIEMQSAVGLDEHQDAGLSQQNAAVLEGDYDISFAPPSTTSDLNQPEEGQEAEPEKVSSSPLDFSTFKQNETQVEVTMKNGKVWPGQFVGVNGNELAIRTKDGMEPLLISNIAKAVAV